jgi:hypothetical protein
MYAVTLLAAEVCNMEVSDYWDLLHCFVFQILVLTNVVMNMNECVLVTEMSGSHSDGR